MALEIVDALVRSAAFDVVALDSVPAPLRAGEGRRRCGHDTAGWSLVILFGLPLAFGGAIFATFLFHYTINAFSLIGMILLVGLAIKNGILGAAQAHLSWGHRIADGHRPVNGVPRRSCRRFAEHAHPWRAQGVECPSGIETFVSRNSVDVSEPLRFISSIGVITLSLVALLTVASGYALPPRPNDSREYIFQLSIVALVPMTLLFLATADWRQPLRSARPLALAVAISATAFGALYVLEHYR
jgi:hypothetical protein